MRKILIVYSLLLLSILFQSCKDNSDVKGKFHTYQLPSLKTNNKELDTLASVFHLAIGDIISNIRIRHDAEKGKENALLFAGFDYTGAWTRDASINVWNGLSLLFPEVAKNSLLEVLNENENGDLIIKGQYWDNIIWTVGAWEYYNTTGDKDFLKVANQAISNTLKIRERDEYDPEKGLFRGPAVYGDGISAYDKKYTQTGDYHGKHWLSNIDKWVEANPEKKAKKGFGMPMMVLSTNAIYYQTYLLLDKISIELDIGSKYNYQSNAVALKKAIQKEFWNVNRGSFDYYIDPWGRSERQEGLGLAFSLLFGISSEKQTNDIFNHVEIAPAGFPALWPSYERYSDGENSFGRHSGTVWTHVQGIWMDALAQNKKVILFEKELQVFTYNAFRDKQFREIYHPITGLPYGGLQEDGHIKDSIIEWESTHRQAWGATSYLRAIISGLFGLRLTSEGISFSPCVPIEYDNLKLLNIHYREAILNIYLKGKGTSILDFKLNGKPSEPFLQKSIKGINTIEIILGES